MKEVVQQSVQEMPSSTRVRHGTSSSGDSKDATKGSEVLNRPNGSWGPIFKDRENFVEMHLV